MNYNCMKLFIQSTYQIVNICHDNVYRLNVFVHFHTTKNQIFHIQNFDVFVVIREGRNMFGKLHQHHLDEFDDCFYDIVGITRVDLLESVCRSACLQHSRKGVQKTVLVISVVFNKSNALNRRSQMKNTPSYKIDENRQKGGFSLP